MFNVSGGLVVTPVIAAGHIPMDATPLISMLVTWYKFTNNQ